MTDAQAQLIRKVVATLAVIALVGALVLAFLDDATQKPLPPQGDMLGTESGESLEEYQRRAATSLADAPSDQPAYALITFAAPLSPADAAELLEPVGRVNAMIISLAAPFPLPEPVAGETRADVFERELEKIATSMVGVGHVVAPETLDAVVVRDTPQVLRPLAGSDLVAAVEVLPPDAAWGRFGVRPVEVRRAMSDT